MYLGLFTIIGLIIGIFIGTTIKEKEIRELRFRMLDILNTIESEVENAFEDLTDRLNEEWNNLKR